MKNIVKEIEETQDLKYLRRAFNSLYNANEQKKQENYKLRGENRSLKKRNYELTLLIDTFLNIRRKENMGKITETQNEILTTIKTYITTNGYSPSVRELCKMNGLSSPATMNYHLKILKQKGYITYKERTPRSIVVLD